MLVFKAIMNKNTLTSTFCHKSNRVRFSLTYLLTRAATDLDLRHKWRLSDWLTDFICTIRHYKLTVNSHTKRSLINAELRRTGVAEGVLLVSNIMHEIWPIVLRKIIKIVATRCKILRLKCTKFDFSCGSAPDPAGEAYSAPPDPL